nr:hypothetical protein HCOI_01229200 [Haemonchus contortus]
MRSPTLEKSDVIMKNARCRPDVRHGKLRCKIEMKGIKTEGYAYVTLYSSLKGIDWIQGNEKMTYHMHMTILEVKLAPIEEALEKLIQKFLKKTWNVAPGRGHFKTNTRCAHRILPRPVPHAAMEKDISRLLKECIRNLPLTMSHEHVRISTERDPRLIVRSVKSYVKRGRQKRDTIARIRYLITGEGVVIPKERQANVFKELHVGHPGIVREKSLLEAMFIGQILMKSVKM